MLKAEGMFLNEGILEGLGTSPALKAQKTQQSGTWV